MWWRRLAEVQTEHQNGEERGFKWLNVEWLLVSDGLVWVFQKLLIYWDFHTQPSLGFTENDPKKRNYPVSGSCVDENALFRRMDRLVRDDRKTTVTQITTRYNQDMQNTISEHTTRQTLKQMGSSSRRPHRVPLLSDKNRTRRIQFTQNHQNWTKEDCKNVVWSDETGFLLLHSDVGSEFGVKNMKAWSILPCLNGSDGGGGVMVWGMFSWHTFLAHFVPIEHRLNVTVYLSIVAGHVHPFMTTVYHLLMYFQQDNAPSQSSNHLRLVSWTWKWVHFTQMTSTVTRSQSNRAYST